MKFSLEDYITGARLILTEVIDVAKYNEKNERVEGETDGKKARIILYGKNLEAITVKTPAVCKELRNTSNQDIANANNNGEFVFVTITGGTITPYISNGRVAYSFKCDLISFDKS
jgi:hypothetical protein